LGVPVATYVGHENGSRAITTPAAQRYASAFGVTIDFLLNDDSDYEKRTVELVQAAQPGLRRALADQKSRPLLMPQASPSIRRLPVFGLASAGDDGRFLMNGQKIAEVECPPMLMGVPDAYAAYVHGESMIPRYESGETVWVNPHIPPRRRDYVLAQIATDDPTIYAGYVKRFVSFGEELRLEQFNPQKELEFPRPDVISVHKIVFSGES
jgi:phage repressor protein C with HTH and peptisase S24 domain